MYEGLAQELGLQRAVLPAGTPDAGPHRQRRDRAPHPRRGRTSSWAWTAGSSGPTRSRGWCPALDVRDRPRYPVLAALLPPAGRHHPPRRGGLGLRPRRPTGWASQIHPYTRGHRHRRRERPRDRRARPTGARSARAPWSTRTAGWAPRSREMVGVRPPDHDPPAAGAASPSRSSRSSTRSSSRRPCTSTSARPTAASWSSGRRSSPYASYSSRSTLPFLETSAQPHAGAVPVPGRGCGCCASGRACAT